MAWRKIKYPLRMIDLKDNMILKTTEEIKAVSDPYRLKILRVLSSYEEGATASMVAEEMGEVPSKVYYHIKKLEKVGVIEIVKTEVINGIVAKYYKKTADTFSIEGDKEEMNNPLFLNETYKTIKSVYDESLETTRGAINSGDTSKEITPMIISASDLALTVEEMNELIEYVKTIKNKGSRKKREDVEKVDEGNVHKVHLLFSIVNKD